MSDYGPIFFAELIGMLFAVVMTLRLFVTLFDFFGIRAGS